MDNVELWKQFEITAEEAKKPIEAGRLKGFTDINPVWRFKRLTEVFGSVGTGWKYEITSQRLSPGADGVITAFVDVNLYYKTADGVWSEAIPGIGGSAFVAKEKSGMYTSDECFKMALSDAIGTACKALGMSADIYFSKDRSKYTAPTEETPVRMQTVEDAANYKLTFGKYSGKTLSEIFKADRKYLEWLDGNEKTDQTIKKGIAILVSAAVRSQQERRNG